MALMAVQQTHNVLAKQIGCVKPLASVLFEVTDLFTDLRRIY